jgi:polyhydroxybutyrate depolymerase
VSILEIHGSADASLPYDGGTGDRTLSRTPFPPPAKGLETLGAVNGCPSTPATSTDAENPDLSTQVWQPCRDNTLIERVRVEGASHAWMGHPAARAAAVGEAYMAFDSTTAAWSFLAAHPRV